MPPKKQTFGLVPIFKKKFTSPNPLNKAPLEKGGITPSSPPHPEKNLFGKEKKKINTSSPFFKAPLTKLVILLI